MMKTTIIMKKNGSKKQWIAQIVVRVEPSIGSQTSQGNIRGSTTFLVQHVRGTTRVMFGNPNTVKFPIVIIWPRTNAMDISAKGTVGYATNIGQRKTLDSVMVAMFA